MRRPVPRIPGAYIEKKWSSSVVDVARKLKSSFSIASVSGDMSITIAACARVAIATAQKHSGLAKIARRLRFPRRFTSSSSTGAPPSPTAS